jgi:hypothetical protein
MKATFFFLEMTEATYTHSLVWLTVCPPGDQMLAAPGNIEGR